MADIPEQPAAWPEIPLISTADLVLGGNNGPANRQAVKILQRMQLVKVGMDAATASLSTLQPLVAQARSGADAALTLARTADTTAAAAQTAAGTAQTAAAAAAAAASTADTKAVNAQTMANQADTKATAAQTAAGTANTNASAAMTTAAAKATRIDLGTVSLTYTAGLALGAGARSVAVNCSGAQVGDAVFVAATAAIPDGYAVAAAQCLAADVIRVSVVHPALALGASFTIPLRVFVLR
ncbi:hypothetical protein ABVD92_20115 [Xanthomonas euvesicatoria]